MSILSTGKDKILGLFLRQRLNELLQEIGAVESLAIDTEAHTLAVAISLEGETSIVDIAVRSYKIIVEGERRFLVIGETSVTKPWMETLVRRYLLGKRIALPSEYGDLVERLLG